MSRIDDVIAAVVIAAVIYLGILLVASARADSACLARGFTSGKIDYAINQYCIRRVDQTDVVIPLAATIAESEGD